MLKNIIRNIQHYYLEWNIVNEIDFLIKDIKFTIVMEFCYQKADFLMQDWVFRLGQIHLSKIDCAVQIYATNFPYKQNHPFLSQNLQMAT